MKLYLVRHGQAQEMSVNPLCPLSEEGIEQIHKLGDLLKQQKVDIKQIYHSEQLRAEQSAVILAKVLKPQNGLVRSKDLDPSASIEAMVNLVEASDHDILCVSHEPFIQKLVSYLLTRCDHYTFLKLSTASVVCLERILEKWVILCGTLYLPA